MMDTEIDVRIRRAMVQRAHKLQYGTVYDILDGKPFILAGGAMSGDAVHDFDIYPDAQSPYTLDDVLRRISLLNHPGVSLLARTKNALTVMLKDGQVVQFCSYLKASLVDLVRSFDFSHVQAGIRFCGAHEPPRGDSVYYTDAFVATNVTRQTEYTGTEYPTSSLVRVLKYYKRGKMTKGAAGRVMLKVLADVIRQGFKDYADFKDQMDAIDLGLPGCEEACDLYKAASDAGLVHNVTDNNKTMKE